MMRTKHYSTTEDVDNSEPYDTVTERTSEPGSTASLTRNSTGPSGEIINRVVGQRSINGIVINSAGYAQYENSLGSTCLKLVFYSVTVFETN